MSEERRIHRATGGLPAGRVVEPTDPASAVLRGVVRIDDELVAETIRVRRAAAIEALLIGFTGRGDGCEREQDCQGTEHGPPLAAAHARGKKGMAGGRTGPGAHHGG